MTTLQTIKQQIARQRQQLRKDSQALTACKRSVSEEAQRWITHPAAFALSFGTGWYLARLPRRPKKIKQAKNVTIKRQGMTTQVVRTLVPFFLAEIRRGGSTATRTGNGEAENLATRGIADDKPA